MKIQKTIISIMSVGVVAAMLLVSTGCQSSTSSYQSSVDELNRYAEQYLPESSLFVATLDLSSDEQRANFDTLKRKFVSEEEESELYENFFGEVDEIELGEFDREYFLSAAEKIDRITIAVDRSYVESSIQDSEAKSNFDIESIAAPIPKKAGPSEPEVMTGLNQEIPTGLMAVFHTTDNEFITNLISTELGEKKQTEDGLEYWFDEGGNSREEFYWANDEDMWIMSDTEDGLASALERANSNQKALDKNKHFRETMDNLTFPNSAYFYIDYEAYWDFVSDLAYEDESLSIEEQETMNKILEIYTSINTIGYTVNVQPNGVEISSLTTIGKVSELREFFPESGKLNLVDKVPGEGLLFYYEFAGGLDKMIRYALDEIVPMIAEAEGVDIDIYEEIKTKAGIDVEKNALSFLDKNLAFYLSDSGEIAPEFGFMVNASSNPTEAQLSMDRIDMLLTLASVGAMSELPEEDKKELIKDKVDIAGADINRFSFDLKHLPTDGVSPQDRRDIQEIFGEGAQEFYYGLTGDDNIIFSFQKNLAEKYNKNTLIKSEAFNVARKNINSSGENALGLTFFDIEATIKYADNIITILEDGGTKIFPSNKERDVYEEVISKMAPLKSIISESYIEEDGIRSQSFILID